MSQCCFVADGLALAANVGTLKLIKEELLLYTAHLKQEQQNRL